MTLQRNNITDAGLAANFLAAAALCLAFARWLLRHDPHSRILCKSFIARYPAVLHIDAVEFDANMCIVRLQLRLERVRREVRVAELEAELEVLREEQRRL